MLAVESGLVVDAHPDPRLYQCVGMRLLQVVGDAVARSFSLRAGMEETASATDGHFPRPVVYCSFTYLRLDILRHPRNSTLQPPHGH